ncbi:MAG: DUF4167 domain-containing protein [Cohaesibacter sp.]|nr:DUF4167 domain-containing protein [Cohaesibacter sp.]MCV6603580.1 DUF4167 domain-containing protein [Cohaesibacter sp.]
MRQGQKNNRMRGRGRKPSNPLTRSYDSNGPDVKIRGTANHIAEKYQSLARDALASGDIVMAENYYQHAEHYLRIIASAQANSREQQSDQRNQPAVNGSGEQPQGSARPARRPRSAPVDLAGEEQPDIEVVEIADVKPASVQDDPANDASEAAPVAQEVEAADDANGEGEEEAPAPKRRRRAPAPRTPRTPRTRRRAPAKNASEEAGDAPAVPAAALADAPQPVIAED